MRRAAAESLRLYVRMFRLFGRDLGFEFGFGLALGFVFVLVSLSTPLFTKIFLDDIIARQDIALLKVMLVLLIGLVVFGAAIDLGFQFLLTRVSQRLNVRIKSNLFERVQSLPISFFHERQRGEIVYRVMNDTDVIQTAMTDMVVNVSINAFILIVVAAIMLAVHWQLSLFVLAVMIVQLVAMLKFRPAVMKYVRLGKRESELVSAGLFARIDAVLLTKAAVAHKRESLGFHNHLHRWARILFRSHMIGRLSQATISAINNFWSFGVLLIGSHQVLSGHLTLGEMMGFLMLAQMLFPPIATLAGNLLAFQETRASIDRFLDYFDRPPEPGFDLGLVTGGADVTRGSITFENVTFGHQPDRLLLRDLSFHVAPGSSLAVVGRSGIGKTTLIYLLLRFHEPLSGRILIDGIDIREIPLPTLRRRIGIVFQSAFVTPGTIAENISYGLHDVSMDAIRDAARAANLDAFVESLPAGYETVIGERGVNLSGGEMQRISLARAFLKDPRILILDEATNQLDPATERLVSDAVERLMEGRTTIAISHHGSAATRADLVLKITDGGASVSSPFDSMVIS